MKESITDLSDPRFGELFTGIEASWFRLETLQKYAVDYEESEYQQFLRTGSLERAPDDWQHMIGGHIRAGRVLQRVHVIEEPQTDYIRYELAAYTINAQAGEDIRLISTRAGAWPEDLPQGYDFWLFDDSEVWAMEYNAESRFVAATNVTTPDELARCRAWRDAALAAAVTLAEYQRPAVTSEPA